MLWCVSDPYGQTPSNPYSSNPYGQPLQQQPYAAYPQRDPDKRPGTVIWAAVLAIVGSALTLLAAGFFALVALVASEDFVDGVEEGSGSQITSDDTVVGVVVGIGGALAVWSVVAIVLAILVLRRSNVARILLVVSSAVAALVSLLAMPLGLPVTTMAITAIVLLFVGGAGDWFARRDPSQLPPGYQPG